MVNKYTSIKRVISKVITDLDLKDGTNRIADYIEWSSEALEKIGAFPYFITKVTGKDDTPTLVLSDYQCKLPLDTHRVLQIGYSAFATGPFYPMRYSTGTFDASHKNANDTTNPPQVFSENDLVTVAMDLFNISYADALTKLNNEPDTESLISAMLNTSNTNLPTTASGGVIDSTDFTYVINGGYVKTNKKDGYLMMAYQAIPLDIDGLPMIPDDMSFIDALYWYITMKLYYPEWKAGRIRDEVYYDARRSWNFYCKQAYGNALMPNYDELESIKNTWLKLIPTINEHSTFFTALGQQEQVYNQNNPRFNSYYEKIFYNK